MFGVRLRDKMKINRPITNELKSSDSSLEKVSSQKFEVKGVHALYRQFPEGSKKNYGTPQDSRCPGRDSKQAFQEYNSETLPLR